MLYAEMLSRRLAVPASLPEAYSHLARAVDQMHLCTHGKWVERLQNECALPVTMSRLIRISI